MNDNVLIRKEDPAGSDTTGLFRLDWETSRIKLGGGKFTHEMRRPQLDELLERDRGLQTEIPIGRDGSYQMPDPTAAEDVDAELYDRLTVSTSGYAGAVPTSHKAAAVRGLYNREFAIAEGSDIFGDEVSVTEEIGSGAEADFTIVHVLRQPTEEELRQYRRKTASAGEVKPGKRGKQIFVSRSNLKAAIAFYDQLMVAVRGAHIGGETFRDDLRQAFANAVDPLIKKDVVSLFVGELTQGLSD